MDIRRIPLWESRNGTFMSNDLVRSVVEDQGEVVLELSAQNIQGGRVNALSLPYFRGTGSGVFSDPNRDWWKSRQGTYQAGGIYFSFPFSSDEHITTGNTYWMVRRYGSESEFGGIWRLSEMKSREDGNRYHAFKIDMMLPGHPVLYSLIKIRNTGEEELKYNASMHAVLSPPFLESGCLINTSQSDFIAFPPNLREVAFNRLKSGVRFSDLKHAPGIKGNNVDAAYIPGPNGAYDYIMGNISSSVSTGWISVINPRQQLIWLSFFPAVGDTSLPPEVARARNVDLAMNYAGRMDAPWALYEGGTPQVFSLTAGFGIIDHHGAFQPPEYAVLQPGEEKIFLSGHAVTSFDNPRISGGFFSVEKADHGLVCKRTKSYAYIQADYSFTVIRNLAERLLRDQDQKGQV